MKTIPRIICFFLCFTWLILSFASHAGWGHRHYHHHPYGYVPGGYYDRGWYPGWGGPNVIINVPVMPAPVYVPPPVYVPQYIPQCEVVEVCSPDACWLEQECR
ncbi:hypothetical protein [Legionella jamestowniensis]|uniref:Glycine-rich protein n=1 Tax=Legionella jamestowniensis TaxID=455 RepID=A0A0W0UM37_9GAMM|nr:hypothetical protein [Legionella jamestowniensis]KTD08585.1 hypothetical protein Ljam_2780 [Legionella jamestowniensis]OCH96963.1 hypothetical protein A8135_04820 [Legionella jamestowniensis]SFL53220.1 hypothetical protein SAMN02746073_0729 [Legionella jamestowniensis DSM 19215]